MTLSPEEPYNLLASFLDWNKDDDDPDYAAKLFDYWFSNGFMFKGPDYLLLFGDHPSFSKPEAWYVCWAETVPCANKPSPLRSIARFVSLMPHYRPYVIWERGGRGRSERRFSTDRLLALIKK